MRVEMPTYPTLIYAIRMQSIAGFRNLNCPLHTRTQFKAPEMVTSGSPATTQGRTRGSVHPSPALSTQFGTLRILKIQWQEFIGCEAPFSANALRATRAQVSAARVGSIVWANDVANGAQVTSSATLTKASVQPDGNRTARDNLGHRGCRTASPAGKYGVRRTPLSAEEVSIHTHGHVDG